MGKNTPGKGMASIFTPINQVKLTNVSIVRLKKGGKRFELACYKNKVLEFRSKITKDLDEVLQIRSVFTNVSKGATAKAAELEVAFKTTDLDRIILEILAKGEIQVSSKERDSQSGNLMKEIATIVAEKCVNPGTKLPYPVTVIEKAMAQVHFAPKLNKNAKQQALEVIKLLEADPAFPISRAQMRLLVACTLHDMHRVREAIDPHIAAIEEERKDQDGDGEWRLTVLVFPGAFREINEAVSRLTRGKGTVHTLNLKVLKETEDTSSYT